MIEVVIPLFSLPRILIVVYRSRTIRGPIAGKPTYSVMSHNIVPNRYFTSRYSPRVLNSYGRRVLCLFHLTSFLSQNPFAYYSHFSKPHHTTSVNIVKGEIHNVLWVMRSNRKWSAKARFTQEISLGEVILVATQLCNSTSTLTTIQLLHRNGGSLDP
jgi:hypothetical protein